MIVTQENVDSHPKALSGQTQQAAARPLEGDMPPAYEGEGAGSSSPQIAPAAPLSPPTNFVYMKRRNQSIKDKWAINPNLPVPMSMLPPLEEGMDEAERKNLYVYSQYSSVDAEVWVVEGKADGTPVTFDCGSDNSSVTLKIHRTSENAPFSAHVSSKYSSVTVHLPRSFNGPLTASTQYGSIKFSDAMTPTTTVFSEVEHTMRAFVGDYAAYDSAHKDGGWKGDVLVAESINGSVRVKYYDEAILACAEGRKSLLGKLFGRW